MKAWNYALDIRERNLSPESITHFLKISWSVKKRRSFCAMTEKSSLAVLARDDQHAVLPLVCSEVGQCETGC
jgi:hypothetical protein